MGITKKIILQVPLPSGISEPKVSGKRETILENVRIGYANLKLSLHPVQISIGKKILVDLF